MATLRTNAGWGFLFFVGLVLVIVGLTGNLGNLLAAILTPDALQPVDGAPITSSAIANLAAVGRQTGQ